jgi:hypothetical protein
MSTVLDYSRIMDQLYVAAQPTDRHAEIIVTQRAPDPLHVYRAAGTGFDVPPFQMLHLRTFDSPLLPMPLSSLWHGVETALPEIQAGRSVLAYCKQGRHRSVAMACCILIGLGYSASDAMKLVKEKRPAADPGAWHIQRRIRKFEQCWQEWGG